VINRRPGIILCAPTRLNSAHSASDVALVCVCATSAAIRLLFCVVLVAITALACPSSRELQKAVHLNLGVHFATRNPLLEREFQRALGFWSGVLDMKWHHASHKGCDVELIDGKPELFGPIDVARALSETGTVAFDERANLNEMELYAISVHELGHLFGLDHNPSPKSVMFYLDVRGDEVLDADDITALASHHRLRESIITRGRGAQPTVSISTLDAIALLCAKRPCIK
jgi:matrixin